MAQCHRRSRYVVAERAIATSVLETVGVAHAVSEATYLPCVWRRLAMTAGLLTASPVALAALVAGPIEQAPAMSDTALSGIPVALLPVYLGAGATCRTEEHTSALQSIMRISYAVFGLKKKN